MCDDRQFLPGYFAFAGEGVVGSRGKEVSLDGSIGVRAKHGDCLNGPAAPNFEFQIQAYPVAAEGFRCLDGSWRCVSLLELGGTRPISEQRLQFGVVDVYFLGESERGE